jgi:Tfp pilus assembly protein PilF
MLRNRLNTFPKTDWKSLLAAIWGIAATWGGHCCAQSAISNQIVSEIRVVELQGTMEISPSGTTTWGIAQTNQILHPFDRLRTGVNTRIALRWSDQSIISFDALTEIEILPPAAPNGQSGLHLIRGIASFFHRDKPGSIRVITRGAVAGVEGTEFVVDVDDTERTTLSVIDGRVQFGNEHAMLVLTNGQQALADLDKAPIQTTGFIANNVLQWCFYYPAVLDVAELPLTPDERKVLGDSLDAYNAGDLPSALAKYPAGRQPGSDAERVYYAALLLSVGQVDKTEAVLSSLPSAASERTQRLATALRQLISAVKRQPDSSPLHPQLASEFLASSYYEQSRSVRETSLETALHLARQAATNSPNFGFAWERVAELEFSFGRTAKALETLEKGLALAPRNAQALALKGFLLAAQNQTREAIVWFDRAIAVDSSLGNAWLGRGLCRIRRGDATGGREDLLVAAALEPQRAGLRSYLGKAYANAGDSRRAEKELQLAKKLDSNDPTAWLYSALLNQQGNRINDAIRDLEKSEELNDNRSVYRSQLLLDQDQAVRSASLATMYKDAGMFDVSVREAARAVNYDYANYSAHLFLADSYNGLRDPNEINLRYETPAESEYLVANLLAPVSAGPLSPAISQGEYSRLFARDGFGVASSTEYLSRGAWTQSGAQFGVFGNFSYDVEALYRSDPGQRANNDIEQRQLSLTLKQQLTPKDSVYLEIEQYDANFGDLSQQYFQNMADPYVRGNETQNPIVGIGYNHEWSPGVHTLFFASRLNDTTSFTNPAGPTLVEFTPGFPPFPTTLTSVQGLTMQEHYVDRLTIYSGELQQIWEQPAHSTIIGTRIQYGHFVTANLQASPDSLVFIFPPSPEPVADQDITSVFRRISFYGYHQWRIFEPLQLIGGLAYDRITFPENSRTAPVSGNGRTEDEISPKAGMIWTPLHDTAVRFAYTRSLAGASMEQSHQIEPSQVAGFIQNYRSVIPESIAGANAGAGFETFNLSLEQKFRTGTYLTISGEILNSTVNRIDGAFDYNPFSPVLPNPAPSGMRENLDYQEKSLQFTANQLLGRGWAFGAKYRLSEAVLNDNFADVPDSVIGGFMNFQPRQRTRGTLQQADLTAIYNHRCGFFAEGEALWSDQSNGGYPNATTAAEPGDDFWQFNLYAGWHFPRRKAELSVTLLNIAGQDYQLNPLNIYNELPRSRTLAMRLQINF